MKTPAPAAFPLAPLTGATLLVGVTLLAGCASTAPDAPDSPVATKADPANDLAAASTNLQSLFDQKNAREASAASRARAPRPSPLLEADADTVIDPTPLLDDAALAALARPAPVPTRPAAPAESLDEQQHRLAQGLADVLMRRLASQSDDPAAAFATAIRLAGLSMLDDSYSTVPGVASDGLLSPRQAKIVADIRDVLASLPPTARRDPEELVKLFSDAAMRISAIDPLKIPTCELCTRVESFGRFTPFPSSTFIAGRTIRALVYAEVANFSHRPVSAAPAADTPTPLAPIPAAEDPDANWTVDLTQELRLYSSDDVLCWRIPPKPIHDTSRNRRHDYYIVQRIDTPPLGVGKYTLKVIIRDQANNAVAEHVLPLVVVADASALAVNAASPASSTPASPIDKRNLAKLIPGLDAFHPGALAPDPLTRALTGADDAETIKP